MNAMNALFPYAETTVGVTVRASVTFSQAESQPENGRWFWTYHIRIENGREAPVQLVARRWVISDGRGAVYRREGEGVVGEKPVIQPGSAYDYVSGCPLPTPTGWMEGSYFLLDNDGHMIEARIPRFTLQAGAVPG